MRRETADVIGSGLLLAALVTVTFAALAPAPGASAAALPVTSRAAVTPPSTIERGRALFYAKGCVGCHRKAGEQNTVPVGPDLTGLADRAAARKPGMSAEAYVRESIRTPGAFIAPGFSTATFSMPDLGLSDDEIATVTAFLLGTP